MAVHIIAEAGSNHNGSVDLAFRLNAVAAAAGADSVKYQIIYPAGLYRSGDYAYGNYDIREVRKIREDGVMTDAEWHDIEADASARNIAFSASIFDVRGLELLCRLNPPYIKIASCDLNNVQLLRKVAAAGRKIVLSTGMSSLGDIEKAVSVLTGGGLAMNQLVLLHCVSSYPCSLNETNLAFLSALQSAFGTEVGFSDHTLGKEAACAAIALGATWLEKHFTIDRSLPGFDHKYAMEEAQFHDYVKAVRAIEESMSHKLSKIVSSEALTRVRARRGIYAGKNMPAGHIISEEDLVVLRPESQIDADDLDALIGCKLKKALNYHDEIMWADLSIEKHGVRGTLS